MTKEPLFQLKRLGSAKTVVVVVVVVIVVMIKHFYHRDHRFVLGI